MIAAALDPESWEPWDRDGRPESVLTGRGTAGGRPVALVVSEFGFAGGSIGAAAGRRIVDAVRRATEERLPVLAMPASGGTRMQEGTPAFLQMAAITAVVGDHRDAGLPYLVYLRHPTTGGVFASWGSVGDAIWAQPGALTGFLGPKVFQGLYGKPFPPGVQYSDNLRRLGFIDEVFAPAALGRRLAAVLEALDPDAENTRMGSIGPLAASVDDAWAAVESTRTSGRIGFAAVEAYLGAVHLAGDGPIRFSLARFGGRPTVLVGQDRSVQSTGHLISAAELRIARRAIALADRWSLPLVTVVDTSGGELSAEAEEAGLGRQIAHCTAELLGARVPTASILLGQGTGGAALAMFPTDLRVAASDAWLAPLPPEGAGIIMHGDVDQAPAMAREQHIWSRDLHELGILDAVDATVEGLIARIDAWAAADPKPDRAGRVRVGR